MFQRVPLSVIRSFFTVHTALVWYMSYIYHFCKLYIFRTVPLPIIRSFFTVHTAMVWYMSYIYHCCVYSEKTSNDGQRNCPKHVEFHSKNKFEKLVHLVGFIIRMPLRVLSIGALPQGFPIRASEERGRCTILKPILDLPLGVSAPSRFPFWSPYIERDALFQEPF